MRQSVTPAEPGDGWLTAPVVLAAAGLFLLLRLLFSGVIPLHGDEAFYWLESRQLALAYSDVPPLTPWTVRLGTEVFGDSYLGVRSLFLLAAALVPLLVYTLARQLLPATQAGLAALLSLCLPAMAISAGVAAPEILLKLFWLGAAVAVYRGVAGSLWAWLATGLMCAGGLMVHYRFGVFPVVLAAWLLSTVAGRAQLRSPGPWLAGLLTLAGALPALVFNVQQDMTGFSFHLVERHPWQFQAEGLLRPLVDALVLTPGLFVLLLLAAVALLRRRSDPRFQLLAFLGLGPLVIYWGLGPWTDQDRSVYHWTAAAHLTLCAIVPLGVAALRSWLERLSASMGRWLSHGLVALSAVLGLSAGFGMLGYTAWVAANPAARVPSNAVFPDNWVSWPQVAQEVARRVGPNELLIADNFRLGAQLSFELQRRVYMLDHPLNARHGRARQLDLLGLGQRDVPADWQSAWLAVDETARDPAELPAALRSVCDLAPGARLDADLSYFQGRKRYLLYRLDQSGSDCDLPAFSYLDAPSRDARLSGRVEVSGWAFEDNLGVQQVQVVLDGDRVFTADYGLDYPGVAGFFPGSTDPNHPQVGFRTELDTTQLANGWQNLVIRVIAADGGVREARPIRVRVDNPAG